MVNLIAADHSLKLHNLLIQIGRFLLMNQWPILIRLKSIKIQSEIMHNINNNQINKKGIKRESIFLPKILKLELFNSLKKMCVNIKIDQVRFLVAQEIIIKISNRFKIKTYLFINDNLVLLHLWKKTNPIKCLENLFKINNKINQSNRKYTARIV